jgi:hypothetical protein
LPHATSKAAAASNAGTIQIRIDRPPRVAQACYSNGEPR